MRIRRVLIANRGEIAVRIIRACRELGIETVQAYSEADRDSLPVRLADHAVCIGPPRSAQSYLNAEFLVSAARAARADAIHPGYGFLSENAAFAQLCELEGITFIGPRSGVIRTMGDKAEARRQAAAAGVPVTPGSPGVLESATDAIRVAGELGYPVMLKARAGGGGRGMRVVASPREMPDAYAAASREAKTAFGDEHLYLERFFPAIRHIEVQVLSDGANAIHLGERDCSIQRRNQKLVEESPSPALDAAQRESIGRAAVDLCRQVGYSNAGTIEFMWDIDSRAFYFMEMNTRIQVEHPVTEMVTGLDLVKAQVRIAAGEPLGVAQEQVRLQGHAIECRINAEDVGRGFLPCPGRIGRFHAPGGPGIRVDSHLHSGYQIPPFYDSLLAKVIAWGADREEAIARMHRALTELTIDGTETTTVFHQRLLHEPAFRAGSVHTRYVEQILMSATEERL